MGKMKYLPSGRTWAAPLFSGWVMAAVILMMVLCFVEREDRIRGKVVRLERVEM